MFSKKKDYIKKKYKDVPLLNIGDVNRILQQFHDEHDQFKMFRNIIEQQQFDVAQTSNIEQILRSNVERLIDVYGDAEINLEALDKMYSYIQDDNDLESQITQHELSQIDKSYANTKVAQYERYLIVLQVQLSKNCFAHYSIYNSAIQNMDQIFIDSQHHVQDVQLARKKIQTVKQDLKLKQERIIDKIRAIENVKLLQQKLQQVKQEYLHPLKMYISSLEDGMLDARIYIPLINNLQITEYDFLTKTYREDKIQYTKQVALKGIVKNYLEFSNTYEKHFLSYKYLEEQKLVVSFDLIITKLVMQSFDQKIALVFKQISEIIGVDFAFDNLNDSIAQIPKDSIIEFYRELCCQTLSFIMNIIICSRYHMDSSEGILIKLRKSIGEVLNKIIEIINLTNQWRFLKKEEVICFFGMLCVFVVKCDNFLGQNQIQFKSILEEKFNQFIETKGNDKLIKDFIINEDCKKCMKITLNQTQSILSMKSTVSLFVYEDYFPKNLNIFKSIEFKKVLDLYLGTASFKKQGTNKQTTLIYNGKERTILLTYTVNQIYHLLQTYIIYIMYSQKHAPQLQIELELLINMYIYNISMTMLSEEYKKLIFEENLLLTFDVRQDFDNYTNQFDYSSELIMFRAKYQPVITYLKNVHLPEEFKLVKVDNYDIKEKVIFIESIIFIVKEFEEISLVLPQFKAFYQNISNMISGLQELIIRSAVPIQDLFKQFSDIKYDILKEEPQRQQIIDKITAFADLKHPDLTITQQSEYKLIIQDHILQKLIDAFSKYKKITVQQREAMIQDYNKVSKAFNLDIKKYQEFLAIYNAQTEEEIVNYIYQNQVNYAFNQKNFNLKLLITLFYSPTFAQMKRSSKKEIVFQIYTNYSQL